MDAGTGERDPPACKVMPKANDPGSSLARGDVQLSISTARQVPSERLPEVGDLVRVRSRRWLVEEIVRPEQPSHSPIVRLACADDDAQGQSLDVFWDYELDRLIIEEEG